MVQDTDFDNVITELKIVDKIVAYNKVIGVGSTLKNRFVLEELIDTGGMGSIYKARDLRKEEAKDRNSSVAVKVLGNEFRHHPQAFIALQREARRIQELSHPNIITVYDFDRDGDIVFMTMEYLKGTTLDKVIKNPTIELSAERVMHIAVDIAAALERAHQQGVIHSDLKPSNIFITNDGEIKLIDFGIARTAKRDDTLVGSVTIFDAATLSAFTPAYASYEMVEGHEPDPRDDIYAFACIIYELLTGQHPYDRLPAKDALKKSVVAKKPNNISHHMWKTLRKGLSIKAQRRPFSAKAFITALRKPTVSWKFRVSIMIPIMAAIIFAGLFAYEFHTVTKIESTGYTAQITK